jgi:hypothetical protein
LNLIISQVYIGFLPSFIKASFIPGLPPPLGGVTGRLLFNEGVFAFFSDGFKIYLKQKEIFNILRLFLKINSR